MKATELINIVASVIILLSSLYLLFTHYADRRSRLDESLNKTEYLLGKVALIVMSMGTLWALLKINTLPRSQITLNVGLALFMLWTCFRLNRVYYSKNPSKNDGLPKRTIDPKGEDYPEEEG